MCFNEVSWQKDILWPNQLIKYKVIFLSYKAAKKKVSS